MVVIIEKVYFNVNITFIHSYTFLGVFKKDFEFIIIISMILDLFIFMGFLLFVLHTCFFYSYIALWLVYILYFLLAPIALYLKQVSIERSILILLNSPDANLFCICIC